MNDESRLIVTIWETLNEYIPTGDRQDAAQSLVESFIELGYDIEDLFDADDECPYLDKALSSVTESLKDDEDA